MSSTPENKTKLSRRKFLSAAGGAVASGAVLGLAGIGDANAAKTVTSQPLVKPATEPFWGKHQSGIVTQSQRHTYFATFDLTTDQKDDVISLLRYWTAAAARLTEGQSAEPLQTDHTQPASDSAETYGLPAERLTLTFGFGPGMFMSQGKDRYGLSKQRPAAFVDLPKFSGDQLVPEQTGGDVSIQACADDPQVAFHAVRQLSRLAYGKAQLRWTQSGFLPNSAPGQTPRNLLGFKDGSNNVSPRSESELSKFVWVGNDDPSWMRGGSYLVVRRIKMALEHWDRMTVEFQEQAVGRQKYSGAPLGGHSEFESINLEATDKDGNPLLVQNAHARLAAAASNNGAQILRRPYSFNDGVKFTSERWPPWRQAMEYDAGLLFICYQQDPRTGFIQLFDTMSRIDMLNQFVTHVGGGLFACPGGVQPGEYIGQKLFEMA